MEIKKRNLGDIPDFIHELALQCFDEHAKAETVSAGDEIIGQFLDVAFRAGYESAKNIYKK